MNGARIEDEFAVGRAAMRWKAQNERLRREADARARRRYAAVYSRKAKRERRRTRIYAAIAAAFAGIFTIGAGFLLGMIFFPL